MVNEEIKNLSIIEKASLCVSDSDWQTKGIDRVGIPSIQVSDGSYGLIYRSIEPESRYEAVQAVCFPTASSSGCSFDRTLLKKMGDRIGAACKTMGVHLLLGPGINIKRGPLGGRNYEYFSEDPFLTAELGISFVKGVQGNGVGAALKHFFANNQEFYKMRSSSNMDERTMREIYLYAFERIVKEASPVAVIAGSNMVGHKYIAESEVYIKEILRQEWGFEGLVISDWYGAYNRVKALEAGVDISMPNSQKKIKELQDAVENKNLKESVLDESCERIQRFSNSIYNKKIEGGLLDYSEDHAIAKEISDGSVVLMKNEHTILPLSSECKVAFIGPLAKEPNYQGAGTGNVNAFFIIGAYDAALLKTKVDPKNIVYSKGYSHNTVKCDENLIGEALELANSVDVVVFFAGLHSMSAIQGYDRSNLSLPANQNDLIHRISKIQKNIIVVLHNGAPVEMPWIQNVKGVLALHLGGEAIGETTADILFGDVNPSGRLSETYPMRLEDNPTFLYASGECGNIDYGEQFYVGYRYYLSKGVPVLFPFGHGLSYTDFHYKNLRLSHNVIGKDTICKVQVEVINIGLVSGKEVVQLYVEGSSGLKHKSPKRTLKGFEKINLQPGESKNVVISLQAQEIAYWDTNSSNWLIEEGEYKIQICRSCQEVILESSVLVEVKEELKENRYDLSMPLLAFIEHPLGERIWNKYSKSVVYGLARSGVLPKPLFEKLEEEDFLGQRVKYCFEKYSKEYFGEAGMIANFTNQPVLILSQLVENLTEEDLIKVINKMNII